jgi:hypothetical protein
VVAEVVVAMTVVAVVVEVLLEEEVNFVAAAVIAGRPLVEAEVIIVGVEEVEVVAEAHGLLPESSSKSSLSFTEE